MSSKSKTVSKGKNKSKSKTKPRQTLKSKHYLVEVATGVYIPVDAANKKEAGMEGLKQKHDWGIKTVKDDAAVSVMKITDAQAKRLKEGKKTDVKFPEWNKKLFEVKERDGFSLWRSKVLNASLQARRLRNGKYLVIYRLGDFYQIEEVKTKKQVDLRAKRFLKDSTIPTTAENVDNPTVQIVNKYAMLFE